MADSSLAFCGGKSLAKSSHNDLFFTFHPFTVEENQKGMLLFLNNA